LKFQILLHLYTEFNSQDLGICLDIEENSFKIIYYT